MMSSHSRVAALLVCSCLYISGCFDSRRIDIQRYGSAGWSSVNEESVIPGVDQAMIRWHFSGDRLVMVIWTDLLGGGGSGSGGSGGGSSEEWSESGYLVSADGRSLEYSYVLKVDENASAQVGRLTTDSVKYNFSNGPLFLVSTRSGRIQVSQLQLPLQDFDFLNSPEKDGLVLGFKSLANANVDIRDFFVQQSAFRR